MDITNYSEEEFINLPLPAQRKIISESVQSLTDAETKELYEELAKKWLANGAQPTDTVKSLFKKSGILQ